MISRQAILGMTLIFGGAIMVFAIAKQPIQIQDQTQVIPNTDLNTDDVMHPVVQPLTVDMQTEARILEQKQKERAAQALAQEAQTQQLIAARKVAAEKSTEKTLEESKILSEINKAKQEAKQQTATPTSSNKEQTQKTEEKSTPKVVAKQEKTADKNETAEAHNNKSSHKVEQGDTLIRLSRQYDIPVSIIAAANNMDRDDPLIKDRTIKIPSQKQIKELEQKAATAQKIKNIDQRLTDARKEAKKQGINESYSVQVGLFSTSDKADEFVKKLKSIGYNVKAIQGTNGIRVVTNPEPSRAAASALRDKLRADDRIAANDAWVTQIR